MKVKIRGVQQTQTLIKNYFTKSVKKAQRSGMEAAGTIVVKAQRAAVPPAKTKGHDTKSVKRALGKKVYIRKGQISLKVGVGVGKKKGTYRTSAVFLAAGTVNRFSGLKTIRRRNKKTGKYEVVRTVRTKNAIRFHGRVKKVPFVSTGFAASKGAARAAAVTKTKQVLAREAARVSR